MPTAAELGHLAAEALRFEARLTPKPGLVDAANSGAHDDMDLALLLRSADALEPTLIACAEAGASGQAEPVLRELGIAGEHAMLHATAGVNTHKGALFSLGLLAWCAGGLAATGAERVSVENICGAAGRIARPWLSAWEASLGSRPARTHGERAFVEHGLAGARGEAAGGFATVRQVALPALREARQSGRDDAWLVVLVALFASNPDTNLIARGGIEALRAVQDWGAEHRDDGAAALRNALVAADRDWTQRRWSSGGSADLLAVTWWLDQVAE